MDKFLKLDFFEYQAFSLKLGDKKDYSILCFLGVITAIIATFVAIDTGSRGVSLFFIGGLLGVTFLYFQYGFASGWRKLITRGDTQLGITLF